jgi:hypothetical protein
VLLCIGCAVPRAGVVALDVRAGAADTAERLSDVAFLSRSTSRFGAADGYYLYFEATRPGGPVSVLEMDVAVSGAAQVSYREYLGGAAVFDSSVATGNVLVPTADCPCQDGGFALRFVEGTGAVRWLDRGRFGPRGGRCWDARPLAVGDALEVGPVCDAAAPAGGSSGDPSGGGGGGGGDTIVDDRGDDDVADEAPDGCADDGSTDESAGGGCDDSSSSDGCEGDSSGADGCGGGDAGGCAGAGDGGGDCRIAPHPRKHGRRLGLLVPLACAVLLKHWRRRR